MKKLFVETFVLSQNLDTHEAIILFPVSGSLQCFRHGCDFYGSWVFRKMLMLEEEALSYMTKVHV